MNTVVEKTEVNLCETCIWADEDCYTFAVDGKNDKCSDYTDEAAAVEKIKELKQASEKIHQEKDDLENRLGNLVIYKNDDGTWTRFTKIDNLKELEEKGTVFRDAPINRYTTKLETLKTKPKELG